MCELEWNRALFTDDDGIDQWRRSLHACIRATRGDFEYSS